MYACKGMGNTHVLCLSGNNYIQLRNNTLSLPSYTSHGRKMHACTHTPTHMHTYICDARPTHFYTASACTKWYKVISMPLHSTTHNTLIACMQSM